MNEEQKQQTIAAIAKGLSFYPRSPVFRNPSEVGLEFEDIYFQAIDGVPLEGWFMPAKGSKDLIICNHFGGGTRYGAATHIPPFNAPPYGGKEVNFLPKFKALVDAGFNVLCYDMRNHGTSSSGSGGCFLGGLRLYRDVIGSLRFARSFEKTKGMTIQLHSLCMGANSTMIGMKKHPEEFKDVKSVILIQPLSGTAAATQALNMVQITDEDRLEKFNLSLSACTGLKTQMIDMEHYAHAVTIPTHILQVRKDPTTTEQDIQSIFDKLGTKEKSIHWIEDSVRRYDGYDEYCDRPAPMVDFYKKHL